MHLSYDFSNLLLYLLARLKTLFAGHAPLIHSAPNSSGLCLTVLVCTFPPTLSLPSMTITLLTPLEATKWWAAERPAMPAPTTTT